MQVHIQKDMTSNPFWCLNIKKSNDYQKTRDFYLRTDVMCLSDSLDYEKTVSQIETYIHVYDKSGI